MNKTMTVVLALCLAMAGGAAGEERCSVAPLVDVDANGTPVGTTQCADVRPGVAVTTPAGGCSLNFVFSGSDGNRYVGTAGHCITGSSMQDVVYDSPGPEARVRGSRIGEFVYAINGNRRDFALIRLDPGVTADPALAHFGGPTGLYTDRNPDPVVMHHYGRGIFIGDVVPARSSVAPDTLHPFEVRTYSAAIFGDSGSPMIDAEGRAVGVNVRLGGAAGTLVSTRIDHQLPIAEQMLGITLTLETAPLA